MKVKYAIRVKDRQTGKITTVQIMAESRQEAIKIAMRDFGHSYEILWYRNKKELNYDF